MYAAMLDKMEELGQKLTQGILNNFLEGQALFFPYSGPIGKLCGKIESIDLEGDVVEVSCEWLADIKRHGKKWRLNTTRENFVAIQLKRGWNRHPKIEGGIVIFGENGELHLLPQSQKYFFWVQDPTTEIIGFE